MVHGSLWWSRHRWEKPFKIGFHGGCSRWVLEDVPRRRGGTIPLVARVVEGIAAELADGRHTGAFWVRISVGNPRGQRAACCCWETLCPLDLDLGALVYRFGGLRPLSQRRSLLPDTIEDGVSHPPHGAPPRLGYLRKLHKVGLPKASSMCRPCS